MSGWLVLGKVGLSYNPGKVGLGVGRYLSQGGWDDFAYE